MKTNYFIDTVVWLWAFENNQQHFQIQQAQSWSIYLELACSYEAYSPDVYRVWPAANGVYWDTDQSRVSRQLSS